MSNKRWRSNETSFKKSIFSTDHLNLPRRYIRHYLLDTLWPKNSIPRDQLQNLRKINPPSEKSVLTPGIVSKRNFSPAGTADFSAKSQISVVPPGLGIFGWLLPGVETPG
ncbi:MAG TPA: hypothetical protein VHI52_11455, partial [Verrucomicrobiae bacterium]|nr:hypothetical protein [Verrucomicrobiae bacterium]